MHVKFKLGLSHLRVEFNSSLWHACIYIYIGFLLLSKIGHPCLLRGSWDDIILTPPTGDVLLLGDCGIVYI